MDLADFPWRGAITLTIGASFLLYGLLRWLERDDEDDALEHTLAEWVDMPAENEPTKE